MMNQDLVLVMK